MPGPSARRGRPRCARTGGLVVRHRVTQRVRRRTAAPPARPRRRADSRAARCGVDEREQVVEVAVLGPQVAGPASGNGRVVIGGSPGVLAASSPGQYPACAPTGRCREPVNTIKRTSAGMPCRWPRAVRTRHDGRWSVAATGSATSPNSPACPPATVDRVLNGRPGVSARAVRTVEAAVLELERQHSQVRLSRRTLLVDVVVDAPGRFRDAVTAAVEEVAAECPPGHRACPVHDERGGDARAARSGWSTAWAPAAGSAPGWCSRPRPPRCRRGSAPSPGA